MQSNTNRSPPANREIYRAFAVSGYTAAVFCVQFRSEFRWLPAKLPVKQNRGFFSWNRGKFWTKQENRQRHKGMMVCGGVGIRQGAHDERRPSIHPRPENLTRARLLPNSKSQLFPNWWGKLPRTNKRCAQCSVRKTARSAPVKVVDLSLLASQSCITENPRGRRAVHGRRQTMVIARRRNRWCTNWPFDKSSNSRARGE